MTDAHEKTIIYTTVNDLSSYGGVETMIPQEIRTLRSKGYKVHLLCTPPKGELRIGKDEVESVAHYPRALLDFPWLAKSMLSTIWFCRNISKLSKGKKVIVVSFSVVDGHAALLARFAGSRNKLILRIVGPLSYEIQYFANKRGLKQILLAPIYNLLEAYTYLMSDVIFPVSELEQRNVRAYNIDEKKVKILRCGVDSFRFDGAHGGKALPIPASTKVVMFVGRFVEKNGPLVIADAIPEILKVFPQTVFVFVGDGPLRNTLETKLAKEIDGKRVILTGFRSDIPQLHSQADVYVGHISSKVEGLGQTVFEALTSGLPVVTGRDRISEKIVEHGKSAILVQKDDPEATAQAIISLLKDQKLRESMGKTARDLALRTLSFDFMMKEMIAEIERFSSDQQDLGKQS
jgi:glycosyltransferase involved in cell wall biosynthesis